jgi:hypothetical protein
MIMNKFNGYSQAFVNCMLNAPFSVKVPEGACRRLRKKAAVKSDVKIT